MELLPASLTASAVFHGGPFTFAHNREARAVDDEMHAFVGRNSTKREVEVLAAPGEHRVIGRGAVDAYHSKERVQEALGLAQRQVEDETERERGFDREVGVLELPSTRADAARRPGVDGLRCQPQGDVAPADEGAIVGGPVRNAGTSSCTLDGLATSSSQCSLRLHSLEQIERIPVFEPLRPRGIHAPTRVPGKPGQGGQDAVM